MSSSKTNSNFNSYGISLIEYLRLLLKSGEGKTGSNTILNTLSSNSGMILARRGQDISRQGLVFTSINEILKSSSSMKSYPNISNVFYSLNGSILW